MSSIRSILSVLLFVALATPLEAAADREPDLRRGSCDGLLDYADELDLDQVQLIQEIVLGNGMSRVELSMELRNLDRGLFRSASAFPRIDAASNPLGVVLDPPPTEADFGEIGPYGTGASSALLSLTLPSANVQALIDQLEDGTIPIGVHADEETVYPDGTMIRNWNNDVIFGWDNMFRADLTNGGVAEPPYEPGAVYGIWFPRIDPGPPPFGAQPTYDGGAGDGAGDLVLDDTICAGAVGQPANAACYSAARGDAPLYITPGDNSLYGLPTSVHYVRVLVIAEDSRMIPGYGPVPATFMLVQRTDTESIPEIVDSGSFCSGPEQELDPPVSQTRHGFLDGVPVPIEIEVDRNRQIRFNVLPWDHTEVSLSGQIGCHSIKPKLRFRIRDGHVRSETGFETDCNLSAEMRIASQAEVEEAREPFEMWGECIRLPRIPIGPNGIPVTLQIKHLIDVDVAASAGAVVGFSQNWRLGYTVTCEGLGGDPASCTTDTVENPVTTEFTPPQLTDDTNLSMGVSTTLQTALRVGVEYIEAIPATCELGAGLTLETSIGASFAVQPTFDPWWEASVDWKLVGGVDLGLYGLGLVNAEVELFGDEIPVADAGGPLFGGALSPRSAAPLARGAAPAPSPFFVGADQRWSVAIDDTALANGVDVTSIAALPDGSSIALASEPVGGRGRIVKLDRFGAYQWAQRYSLAKRPSKVRALANGEVVVAGQPAWLARHDADGNLLWSFDATVSRDGVVSAPCSMRDVVPIETAPGVYDYVLVGIMGATLATSNDGCALRVEADGDVAWAKVYEQSDVQYFYGATLLRDGAIAVAGEAYVNLLGNRRMPLVVKLDAATGDVIWSRGMPMYRLARLNAIAEGPDGTLFAAGAASRTITQTGAALVARIGANGDDVRHALLYQDFDAEDLFDFEEWTPTSGGDTAYDEFFDIAPQGDGFVVVGRSGLGTLTDAWAVKINQKLGVEWFRSFDGGSTDALTGVDVAPDGIFASGYSGSLPEPDGSNTGENQLWVMKLPFTGAVELRPNANVVSRFLAGAVRFSSEDDAISPVDPGADVALVASDAVVTEAAPDPNFVVAAANQCAGLLTESGHPSTLDTCAEDSDLDGVLDDVDVCVGVWNPDQLDSDGDGAGNACDADLDQDGAIDDADRILFAASFGLAEGDEGFLPAADFDGDGLVGLADFALLRAMQGFAPGDAVSLPTANPLEMPLVELIFPATGTDSIEVLAGALVTVQLRVTPGASGIAAYGFALDFGDGLDFDAASEFLPAGFEFALDPEWSVIESEPGLDGSAVACDAGALGAGAFGDPFVACELSFVATSSAAIAARVRPGIDGVLAGTGADLSAQVALVPATVEVVPEASALASGVAALVAIGALRRRTRAPRAGGMPARGIVASSRGEAR